MHDVQMVNAAARGSMRDRQLLNGVVIMHAKKVWALLKTTSLNKILLMQPNKHHGIG